ncbi:MULTISPECIES: SigE family RNA polymerase sigma factor [Streptosporangium]|uniref:RNA polymerase sigma-70 factor (Sigma-E family) n=1 Tax=Streptosporangium brasiliense TaxID=47480 RepID=A0ABT9QY19_9ACTN|nr:SigE family RNA polymerase sigma factor [Streptosporangium brasiliense]MDP9861886.1 RNA polymerase sigma-70 factor (sigma-E family) [Streptosporangium brasiliense]
MSGPEDDGFGAFVAARGTSLLRVAYLACGDERDAEDLLQTALERTYRKWDRVRHDSPEPYVRRVIVNTAISRARRRAILRILPTHTPPELPVGETDVDLRHVLMDALRALPPRQRAVVVLRYWEDLGETQTAEILGCSVGTVKSQASKALTKLRSALGAESVEGLIRNVHA